ncbi:MAG: S9 family peptidase [Balneolaceae bacterium]|nr:MAG: S9 family peptidase [Balneolaceae bacterium]
MKTLLISLVILPLAVITNGYNMNIQAQDPPPLLDRELFFGDPEISGGQLSPDGAFLSFMRPYDGTRNIWVKTTDADFDSAIPVTDRTDRPIPGYFWSRDGQFILFVMDQGGDENFNIYALDPSEASEGVIPEARNITDLEGVRALIYHIARNDHDLMYVGLNDRDAAWHDLYELRISTGELTKLRENTNRFTSWIFDWEDQLRLASRSKENGDNELWRLDTDGTETIIYEWGLMESAYPSGFHKDNEQIYLVTNTGDDRDLSKLYLMNPQTLEKTFIEKDPENRVDFGGIWRSQKSREIIATSYTDDRVRRYFQNSEFEAHYKHIMNELGGDAAIAFSSGTTDESLYMITAYSDILPASVYLYNMETRQLTYQYTPRSGLNPDHMSHMKPIRYPSSDGLEIPAYLTMPRGFGETNLPVIVVPHGGPWARDTWGFDTYAQFLANRGYAVLQPNFRGSTGFGKAFLNAGNKEWGDLMQDDITWGVKYLVEQGIADPDRVAIFGGSYGGYATLAGLAFTPDLYTAGVSFVGPSNLITLLNSIPPYWESAITMFKERMGDPNTPEGEAELIRQSPLFSADQIKTPLMVVQGQNDPRVVKAESDQIVVALRERGFPVTYLNAPDEGHGFARPVNNMAFLAAMEKFLAEHVGGRYQPDMPEDVAKRLEEITVDIDTVELPEELHQDLLKQKLMPVRPIAKGEFRYNISIEQFGMQLKSSVNISREGDNVVIRESTETPMGSAVDKMTLNAGTLEPVKREINQGPANIVIDYHDGGAEGSINMGDQKTQVNIKTSGPLFAEGPARAHLLATLPHSDGFIAAIRNTDMNTMREKMYRVRTTAESLENGQKTWRVHVTPADGSPGDLTVWLDQEDFSVLRYEQVSPEMGGAKLVVTPAEVPSEESR